MMGVALPRLDPRCGRKKSGQYVECDSGRAVRRPYEHQRNPPPAAPEAQESYVVSEAKARIDSRSTRGSGVRSLLHRDARARRRRDSHHNWHTNEVLSHARNNFEDTPSRCARWSLGRDVRKRSPRLLHGRRPGVGPDLEPPQQEKRLPFAETPRSSGRLRRILLIDDTPEIAELLTFALREPRLRRFRHAILHR